MKFLIDMNLSPLTALHLKEKGHDAVHARDLELKQATDEEVLNTAISQERIIITQDLDFGDLITFSTRKVPGVIIIRIDRTTPERVNLLLDKTFSQIAEADIKETTVVLEEDRVRIHEKD